MKANEIRRCAASKTFIERAHTKHSNKYSYHLVEYLKCKAKVRIVCHMHGEFLQTPNNHLMGNGCPSCKYRILKESTTERILRTTPILAKNFIERSNNVHKNTYDYSLVEFKNAHTNVKIICREHGIFSQLPMNHYSGTGCPDCCVDNLVGGYCEENFQQKPDLKQTPGILYVVEVFNTKERFIKIGVTVQLPKYRLSPLRALGYDFNILAIQQGTIYEVFQLEQRLKYEYSELRYWPSVKFGGHTECFKHSAHKQIIEQLV